MLHVKMFVSRCIHIIVYMPIWTNTIWFKAKIPLHVALLLSPNKLSEKNQPVICVSTMSAQNENLDAQVIQKDNFSWSCSRIQYYNYNLN